MTAIVVGVALAVTLVGIGLYVFARPLLAGRGELSDPDGIRSTLVFRTTDTADEHDEDVRVPTAAVLDAIAHALERAGADVSRWNVAGGVLELSGGLFEATFRITIGSIDERSFVLVVHAHTLGRARWVAPPATESTRTVLRAIDAGVRATPGVTELGWRQRQDEDERVQPTPVD